MIMRSFSDQWSVDPWIEMFGIKNSMKFLIPAIEHHQLLHVETSM